MNVRVSVYWVTTKFICFLLGEDYFSLWFLFYKYGIWAFVDRVKDIILIFYSFLDADKEKLGQTGALPKIYEYSCSVCATVHCMDWI